MLSSLAGKSIVLAGGTGGLGSATARLLAAEGADLVLSYRENHERALESAALGRLVAADLINASMRTSLLDQAEALYGLVVFSGDPARVQTASEMEEAMRRSHEVNYLGPVLLAREAAERMRSSRTPGAIVLMSTMQATVPFAGSTAYAAQKAALIHAGQILAKECRGTMNIRVNILCPGANRAGMAEASIASGKYDRFLNEGMISRFGKAEDVARAVRFLLEPDNYITGQVITIDGGLTL